jgi:hypothetical protein
MTIEELRSQILLDLLRKSSVNGHSEIESIDQLLNAALYMAQVIADGTIPSEPIEGGTVALPDFFKVSEGTAKTIKNSGGSAAITLASLANGNGTSAGGRQSASLDLGANWAQRWRLETNFELAATPTAGNAINLFGSWNTSTGAGDGNTSGSDAAYTGYSNNIDASTKQLEFLGAHICTSQATATVQKSLVGVIFPKGRYLNLVVDNRSGAAFHSTDTNQVITLTPLQDSIEDTV